MQQLIATSFVRHFIASPPACLYLAAASRRLVHWDVLNEPLHDRWFERKLGRSILPWMFKSTRAIDPGPSLFINDYDVVENKNTIKSTTELYLKVLRAPLGGWPLRAVRRLVSREWTWHRVLMCSGVCGWLSRTTAQTRSMRLSSAAISCRDYHSFWGLWLP